MASDLEIYNLNKPLLIVPKFRSSLNLQPSHKVELKQFYVFKERF